MKKTLLACLLLGAAVAGRAQIQINEFAPQPAAGEGEFIELRNAGAATNLQCYTIVTHVPAGVFCKTCNAGFYTMTLPSFAVATGKYIVLSSANSFKIQGISGLNANINWNSLPSGSVKSFELTNAGTAYKVPAGTTINTTTNPITDFFPQQKSGSNITYSIYLFDNTGTFVDGFQGGGGANNTQDLSTYPSIPVSGCSYSSLAWPPASTTVGLWAVNLGNSNSYGREADCGTWAKYSTSPSPTPGLPNIPKTTNGTYTGSLTTTASYYCNTLHYTISGPTSPYYIDVYNDLDNDKTMSLGDTYNTTIGPVTSPGTLSIASGSNVILVYRDALGACVGAVNAPVNATATLNPTIQALQCNQSVSFTVALSNTVTGVDYSFLLPITASLYFGGSSTPVKTVSVTSFNTSFTISGYKVPNDVSNPTLKLTTSAGCSTYDKSFALTPSAYTITVGGQLGDIDPNYNQRQAFFWLDPSGTGSSAYPLTVTMYEDVNNNGKVENGEPAVASHAYVAAPGGIVQYSGYLNNSNSDIVVVGASDNTNPCGTALFATALQQAPLPVHFKSFSAVRKADKVLLNWETATEQDNRGFQVQRNMGNEWKEIAFVFSEADGGNSTSDLAYTFTDLNPAKGVTQYRILQIDLDGKGHYSETRLVRGSEAPGKLLLFPNPSSTGSVTLLFATEGAKNVTITDLSGRMIKHYKSVTGSSLEIKNLTAGFYTVQVSDATSGTTTVAKFIIKMR